MIRHCEERSDEAIHVHAPKDWIAKQACSLRSSGLEHFRWTTLA
jgi:hypothetical protein